MIKMIDKEQRWPIPENLIRRSAFPIDNRSTKYPITQAEREILCAIYDSFIITKNREEGIPLSVIKEKWVKEYNPTSEHKNKFKYYIERLHRWHIIGWSGVNVWDNLNEVKIKLRSTGFAVGVGELRSEKGKQIIHAADTILLYLDTISYHLNSFQIEEKEVIDMVLIEWPDVPTDVIQEAIKWLVIRDLIKIEDPGEGRGRWWIRVGTGPLVQKDDEESFVRGIEDEYFEPDIIFDGSLEEILRHLRDLKYMHEQEMKIIGQVKTRMEILIKKAEETGDADLQGDVLELLSKIPGIGSLFDLVKELRIIIRKYPKVMSDLVPPAIEKAVMVRELPSLERVE